YQRNFSRSRHQLLDELATHIRQPKIASLKTISQLRMLKSEQPQQRRVQIMDVDFVSGRIEPEFVGTAQGNARLDATAGEPHRETIGMMIPAIIAALDHRRASKF